MPAPVLPKWWIVERTFAWISRNRRLARDFELRNDGCCIHPPRHDPSCSGDLLKMPRHESKLLGWAEDECVSSLKRAGLGMVL